MAILTKITSAALVATTLAGGAIATSSSAEAHGHGRFWGGFAVGAASGLIVSQAYRPYYGGGYYYAPACHKEWRYDYYGNPYRVRVCY